VRRVAAVAFGETSGVGRLWFFSRNRPTQPILATQPQPADATETRSTFFIFYNNDILPVRVRVGYPHS